MLVSKFAQAHRALSQAPVSVGVVSANISTRRING